MLWPHLEIKGKKINLEINTCSTGHGFWWTSGNSTLFISVFIYTFCLLLLKCNSQKSQRQDWSSSKWNGLFRRVLANSSTLLPTVFNDIIPWAQMSSKSIAHEVEGWMGCWLRGHEGESNNCFSKIQLVGKQISRQKKLAS